MMTPFEARTFESPHGQKLNYRLLKPLNESVAGTEHPLVLFLHGAGQRGDDNIEQLKHVGHAFANDALRRKHPAYVIAPQCPEEYQWVETPWTGMCHTMPEIPSIPMQLVFQLIENLPADVQVDRSRMYVVGLSMGGFGVWDMLQRKPNLFAAAIPFCGGGDPAFADRLTKQPIWAFHGDADDVVNVSRTREMVDALKAQKGEIKYTEYETVGHDCWTQASQNPALWEWLFDQNQCDSVQNQNK